MKIRNLPKASRSMIGLLALASMPVLAASDAEQSTNDEKKAAAKDATVLPEVSVSSQSDKAEPSIVEKYKLPVTVETVTKKEMEEKINVFNTEDAIKYEPSIFVRKRYVGDNNAPVATRTANASQSARTLIYADGLLLSTLLGNNNTNTGSPRWNTVAPNEIDRVDILYGPFSAAYSGNSIGGVVNITTKMPEKFEAYADAQASWQDYSKYGHSGSYETQNYAGGIGDRVNDLSFRFDYNHLDSTSQPVGYQTNGRSTGPVNTTGAVPALSNFGVPGSVIGETQLYHTIQDNFKWKLAYDISSTLKASYTLGMWENTQEGDVKSWLTKGGVTSYDGWTSKPSLAKQTTWSHGMNLHSETGGKFDWELIGSVVDLSRDTNGQSGTSNSYADAPLAGGTLTSLQGTNWHTADAKGIWRPGDFYGNHEISFGFHHDLYELKNPVYATNNWKSDSFLPLSGNYPGALNSEGKSQTEAYWVQDAWDFAKDWNFTAGGRLESWHTYDGISGGITNAKYNEIGRPERNSLDFSPKGKLTWNTTDRLKLGAAIAQAYRYPTVTELYQTVILANQFVTSNPYLKPEKALSSEISAEYLIDKGKLRLSFFQEQVENAIYSTSSTLSDGSYKSVLNNVGQTDTYGIEFSGDKSDAWIDGLDLFGSATWADARITDNTTSDAILAKNPQSTLTNPLANTPSTGKLVPRIPEWRATFGATYRATDKLSGTVNGRYSGSSFSQINNSDVEHNSYQGNASYFVVDTKLNYKITKQFTLSGGIDNINDAQYIIFHPFPGRTYMAQLKFNY